MNDRISDLRQQVINRTRTPDGKFKIGSEDIFLIQLGYDDANPEDPDCIRRAKGYCAFFEESEVEIRPSELIIGFYNNTGNNSPGLRKKDGLIAGHFAVDYDLMLSEGVDGIFARIESYRTQNLAKKDVDPRSEAFYDACKLVWKGFQGYLLRYKEVADAELKKPDLDNQRQSDLQKISQTMGYIAHKPPRDFHEAVQLVMIYHMLIQYQVGCCSFGRPDRYLFSCYQNSLANGQSEADIKEILAAWFLKVNELMSVPQSIMLGGQDKIGNSTANALTMLMLKVAKDINMLNPALAFAWNEEIPEDFMLQIISNYEANVTHPALFNDLTIIKALENIGMEHGHAIHYCNCTCTEITPEGYSNILVVANYINVNQVLLRVLHQSKFFDAFSDIEPQYLRNLKLEPDFLVKNNPDLDQIADFDTFKELFFDTFRKEITKIIEYQISQQPIREESYAQPLVSIFMHDCLEKGLDIAWGGAKYNYAFPQIVGFPTVVDSLYVIRELIFNQKGIKLSEFVDILAKNWDGNEKLRQKVINKFPKWGNDNDDIDSLGLDVMKVYFDTVEQFSGIWDNSGFYPGFLCWVMHQEFGKNLGATPEGRLAGAAVSSSIGPVAGKGLSGFTAICNSAAKIDHIRGVGSSVLNLTVLKSTISTIEQKQKFISLLETYFIKGGFQIQVNVMDKVLLKDAQMHPENYIDLSVKVGGFSAYFVDLNEILQEELMARNPH
jgi:pyruvate-formate lyase